MRQAHRLLLSLPPVDPAAPPNADTPLLERRGMQHRPFLRALLYPMDPWPARLDDPLTSNITLDAMMVSLGGTSGSDGDDMDFDVRIFFRFSILTT